MREAIARIRWTIAVSVFNLLAALASDFIFSYSSADMRSSSSEEMSNIGASLEVMDRDARKMRGEKPFVFTNLKEGKGLEDVYAFIVRAGML